MNDERLKTQLINDISLLNKLESSEFWGVYFKNEFYFRINTRKLKADSGYIDNNNQLSLQEQRKLQNENLPALFHEFLHYLHEISTVIGNISMQLDITMKSYFTNWLNRDIAFADSLGFNGKPEILHDYARAMNTMAVIDGTGKHEITGKMNGVIGYNFEIQHADFNSPEGEIVGFELNIPNVKFKDLYKGMEYHHNLKFGKFYLYEGLAYEVDRIVDKQVNFKNSITDINNMSEYTVVRQLSKYLFKAVEKKTYLSLAIMALQFLNCGEMFIILMNEVKKNSEIGISQAKSLEKIKNRISSMLRSKRNDFFEAQDEYVQLFINRPQLQQAFLFIATESKRLYDERIANPCFEIDLVLDGKYYSLLDKLQVCDYMYIFNDTDEYMRDFLGTTLDEKISQSFKALIAFDDYYYAHKTVATQKIEEKAHQCPFYTCCNLSIRKTYSDICANRPWRIFEVSFAGDKKYCWYGQGVGEGKGQTVPNQGHS